MFPDELVNKTINPLNLTFTFNPNLISKNIITYCPLQSKEDDPMYNCYYIIGYL